jgi:hypothetical protein
MRLPAQPALMRAFARGKRDAGLLARTFAPRTEVLSLAQPDTVVCRCEDVRERDVGTPASWREVKLRTRIGMGSCQGRICGAAFRARYGVGPDDARAPIFPVPVSALLQPAGDEESDAKR